MSMIIGRDESRRPAADDLTDLRPAHRRILLAAARLFRERGVAAVTMQDIGEAVGLSKAGVYHHAPSKEKLLEEIVYYGHVVLLRSFERARWSSESPAECMRVFIEERMEVIREHQDLTSVIWQERPLISGPAFEPSRRMAEEYRAGMRLLIKKAQDLGEFRPDLDPHLLTLAIDGMTGFACFWFQQDGSYTAHEIGEKFWRFLADGWLTKGS
ncbi:TetR/AcrR family transcriptional regulator [Mycobacterium sp. NPDC003449]